jgi:hypothetical protein
MTMSFGCRRTQSAIFSTKFLNNMASLSLRGEGLEDLDSIVLGEDSGTNGDTFSVKAENWAAPASSAPLAAYGASRPLGLSRSSLGPTANLQKSVGEADWPF